ncbi:cell division cycle- protein [Cladophialophora chaetospira]|uniref:Class E vacuolar protein-sorting machinery protein HSE1 n=1 Tax=Cladophialophora chaetospira TaxID=386627 RepID=A0AA38WZY7_9EURO|nr:cell division cycle- protein [Cladophialophora chaetospira]
MSTSRRVAQDPTSHGASAKPGSVLAAAFQYTEPSRPSHPASSRPPSANIHHSGMSGLSPRRRAQQAAMSSYVASTDLPPPPPPIFVRALYNYEADDHTSLSFRQGDIIQVLTQLESGWWDGVIDDVRGWFPSNYTVEITSSDELGDAGLATHSESETGSGTEEEYDDEEDDSDVHTQDEDSDLPIEGGNTQTQEEAAFWVPQATPDGRLFYFNTLTGVSTMELPLETPTSGDETGPRNRNNFHVPEQTRPPPEMMALGYGNEEEYDGSASEADGEQLFISSHKKGSGSMTSSISASTSMDSISGTAARQPLNQSFIPPTTTFSQANISMALPPLRPTDTSFIAGLPPKLSKSPTPRFFLEDVGNAPLTWNNLVDNMQTAVEAYRHAIRTHARADYVRRAEDISDHLRLLLAAGSGTTDNHSGNPSIISSNKALYPHFREMMSKFSKLVLSSHIAAADWPGPDALTKCLQEADGVMNGVYGYVEVARQQRGEEIPRLVPGFILGSTVGGSWRDNNIESQTNLDEVSFMDSSDESRTRPSEPLNGNLLRRIEDFKKNVAAAIRRLEETLVLNEKVVTPARQSAIGDAVCQGAGFVLEQFRPWISHIESIDLSALGNVFQKPSLVDFGSQKQKSYDSIGELVATCQAVTMPLPDEWAEVRGESLDTRLNNVRGACKQLDTHVSNLGYALELLLPATTLNPSGPTEKRDKRVTDGGETYQTHHLRADSKHGANLRPALADLGQSKSYTLGEDPADKMRRPTKDKARQFFGQIPPNLSQLKTNMEPGFSAEEVPWYLQLDHLGEVTYDTKNDPPQVKSGTLTGLVEQLTRHDRPDTNFTTTFLLTYRSFTTASELFELLVRRFNLQPPQGLSRDEYSIWEEHKQKPARFRVLNIIKTWLEQYWTEHEDANSQALLERMLAFAKSTYTSTKIPLAKALTAIVEQRVKGGETLSKKLVLTLTSSAPAPILPKNMKKLKFLDIDPREFARQLTIMESKLYGKIKPVECLAKTWERKANADPSDTAPNVKALIFHSNKLTHWVSAMILSQAEVKKRVVIIKQFVQIAEQCRALNNFSSVTAIISALGTSHIVRLSRTWQAVNPKTNAMLEAMRNLIASGKNFLQYRETLRIANPPCIPFLGVYLTDLTFIEDGIPSHIKGSELINFAKRTKTAEVIRDIQQYQNVPYGLNPVPELQEWIAENMRNAGTSDDDMFAQSLKIEPREREEEKIARLLSESGFL